MKERVFYYIKGHWGSSHHDVAQALGISERDALKYVNELSKEGYLAMLPPIPLSETNGCSNYYKAIRTEYRAKN